MSTLRVRMVSKLKEHPDILLVLLLAIVAFWFTLNNLLEMRPDLPSLDPLDSENVREQKQLLVQFYMDYKLRQSGCVSLLLSAIVGIVFWILWILRSEYSQLKAATYTGMAMIVSLVFGVAMYVVCYLLSDIDKYRNMLG